mmetsp:Transcript_32449/g.80349  ORF Transcript_32449/g.80349 Transcript_32449/m.80349 type:complete len:81 (+) Transcript_32449:748-990(+)
MSYSTMTTHSKQTHGITYSECDSSASAIHSAVATDGVPNHCLVRATMQTRTRASQRGKKVARLCPWLRAFISASSSKSRL